MKVGEELVLWASTMSNRSHSPQNDGFSNKPSQEAAYFYVCYFSLNILAGPPERNYLLYKWSLSNLRHLRKDKSTCVLCAASWSPRRKTKTVISNLAVRAHFMPKLRFCKEGSFPLKPCHSEFGSFEKALRSISSSLPLLPRWTWQTFLSVWPVPSHYKLWPFGGWAVASLRKEGSLQAFVDISSR